MGWRIAHVRLMVTSVFALFMLACSAAGPTPQATAGSPSAPAASHTPVPTATGASAPVVVGKFTVVTGVEQFVIEDTGTTTTEDGVERGRGLTLKNVDVANDARVSGTTTETWNYDFAGVPPAAGLDWGVRRLTNDGGSWEGIVIGAAFPGSREELTIWMVGSGGYAGLTYYMHAFTSGSATEAGAYPFEGIIYEGAIPFPSFPTP